MLGLNGFEGRETPAATNITYRAQLISGVGGVRVHRVCLHSSCEAYDIVSKSPKCKKTSTESDSQGQD